jgi:hypothetical protein
MFAPYTGPGGALRTRSFVGRQALIDFLTRELHIDEQGLARAWDEISSKGTASIQHVQLNYYELVRSGLNPVSL